ncbi:MAG: hypothetical protein AAFO04_07650 [Cyanobacteria bacterium J06592_8]
MILTRERETVHPTINFEVLECINDDDTVGSDLNWCKVKFLKTLTAQRYGTGIIGWVWSLQL